MSSSKAQRSLRKRLESLLSGLNLKRISTQRLENEISGMGKVEGIQKPSLLRKWLRWMDQLAGLRARERDILSEIGAVERQHQKLRESKALRRAEEAARAEAARSSRQENTDAQSPAPARPPRSMWFWILLAWLMQQDRPKPQK